MTDLSHRLRFAGRAASWHFLSSLLVAGLAALVVFAAWYPPPYHQLAGGRELFMLVVAVDVACGPLLTLVLFSPSKLSRELLRDLALVVFVQLFALGYGVWSVWQARPLFLVQEIDRFKVIAAPDLRGAALDGLPQTLKPTFWSGPITVATRSPKDDQERNTVLLESVLGGRDYGERPEFYVPYEGAAAQKSLNRAKPLADFVKKYPEHAAKAEQLVATMGVEMQSLRYLPVIARQDWIAVLDHQGRIGGFLKGDGF